MKFLIDNNLSPELSKSLIESGFDSVHVKQLNKSSASDDEIFQIAFEENRIIITADVDFGYILSNLSGNIICHLSFSFDLFLTIQQFNLTILLRSLKNLVKI